MKAAEFLFLVVVAGTAVVLVVGSWVSKARHRRALRRAPWVLDEESDGELVNVYAIKPGEERLLIGAAPFSSDDFDARLYELRAEGRAKVYALNESTSLRRGRA